MVACICCQVQVMKMVIPQGDSGVDNTMFPKCGIRYGNSLEKWICCDGCGIWFYKGEECQDQLKYTAPIGFRFPGVRAN